ncbi:unnamed protein product, partial [Staurois parvus]
MYTDHQGTDDQCGPRSATCQCSAVPHASAHQCIPVHINATYQCPSELPFNVTHQCQSVPPVSASYQCSLSVPITAASLTHIMCPDCLYSPSSATCQCPSVPAVSAH